MSEIKGQMLGIILVIAIFGVVLGLMTTAFTTSAEAIQSRVEEAASTSVEPANHNGRAYTLHY